MFWYSVKLLWDPDNYCLRGPRATHAFEIAYQGLGRLINDCRMITINLATV